MPVDVSLPIEVAVTVQEPVKAWVETWGTPILSAASALTGAVIGGWCVLHAARSQVERSLEEADKDALFAISSKLISIADDADRLNHHMTWALEQDRASAVPMIAKPEPVRFALGELYRAYRFEKSNFVDSLRIVERSHLKSLNDYSYALDFSRVAEGPPRLMTNAPKPPREMPDYLRKATSDTAASARRTASAAKDVLATLRDVYRNRYGDVLPTTAQDTTEISPNA